MADVLPFRGLRYNQALVTDLSKVICPPYDIISPAQHEALLQRDEHNFVRIEDARPRPADTPDDNKYTRAAATLQQWIKDRILLPEKQPAVYMHDHYFTHQGKTLKRRGIISRIRLEEWEKGIIKPHEGIIAVHRDDRLSLLWALQANTSPVLAMYQDADKKIAMLLASQESLSPIMDVDMQDGERHVIRTITDPETLAALSGLFVHPPLYIADGHHRYTSALAYKREKIACDPGATANDPFNFVMATLVDFIDPGMVILAPHRALRGVSASILSGLEEGLQAFFDLMWLPVNKPGVWSEVDRLQSDQKFVRLACLVTGAASILVLTLRDPAKIGETMPHFHSDLYRKLDVSIVDHIILEKVLGLGSGFSDEGKISYLYDRQDAVDKVLRGEFQLAFFLKPVSPQLIKEVADAGDKMPRKSTYFYPKAPAGLVVNPLY